MLKQELAVLPVVTWTNLGDTIVGEEDQEQKIWARPFICLPAFVYEYKDPGTHSNAENCYHSGDLKE